MMVQTGDVAGDLLIVMITLPLLLYNRYPPPHEVQFFGFFPVQSLTVMPLVQRAYSPAA